MYNRWKLGILYIWNVYGGHLVSQMGILVVILGEIHWE